MAMVGQEIKSFNVEGKLIIFPAYTYYLQKHGYRISQRHDKHSNRKLNEILMEANIAEAINKEYRMPDFMIYSEGKWSKKYLVNSEYVIIDAGKYGQYRYYKALLDERLHTEAIENAIQAFVLQYSSAKLQVVKVK